MKDDEVRLALHSIKFSRRSLSKHAAHTLTSKSCIDGIQ